MIERQIITALITSTEFIQAIQSKWNLTLIESATAKRLAGWCMEYFSEYQKAPGRAIETIYYEKKKTLSKEIAEEIEEDILPALSDEYERESINIPYLVKEAEKHLSKRHLAIYHQTIEALIEKDQIEEAEKLTLDFRPLSITTNNLKDHIRSIPEIRGLKRESPPFLLYPWLRAGQTTILYGNFGCGKTLLTVAISYMLGCRNYESKDCEINKWQVKNPCGTLYVDGEMGEHEMNERISQFEWLGDQFVKYQMKILSVPEYQMATEDTFFLNLRVNQMKIINWLKDHPNYKLLVLDSVSTLFGLIDENDNSEWSNKINPFLRDLKAIGVAHIILHHAGKSNKKGLRGASAMGAIANNIFQLVPHGSREVDSGEAWFTINKDKQRASGVLFRSFGLHFSQTDDKKETHWEVTRLD